MDESLEQTVIRHVELYKVTIAKALAQVLIRRELCQNLNDAEEQSNKVLSSLVKKKLLARHSLENKKDKKQDKQAKTHQYFTLGDGAGVDPVAIEHDLKVLWSCCVLSHGLHRVTFEEVKGILGEDAVFHRLRHVIGKSESSEQNYLLRAYMPSGKGPKGVTNSIRYLDKKLAEASKTSLQKLIENGYYGFLILAEDKDGLKRIKAELGKKRNGKPPFATRVRTVTALVPSTSTLPEWIEKEEDDD